MQQLLIANGAEHGTMVTTPEPDSTWYAVGAVPKSTTALEQQVVASAAAGVIFTLSQRGQL